MTTKNVVINWKTILATKEVQRTILMALIVIAICKKLQIHSGHTAS